MATPETNARNIASLNQHQRQERERVDALIVTVEAQRATIATLSAEVKALRQDLIMARVAAAGRGPTA